MMRTRYLGWTLSSLLVGIVGCASLQDEPSNELGQRNESLLAFPGAEGAGRSSLGGRGGRVVRVTNLNDSGPGSLRAAIELAEPRTILFEVSGNIALETPLEIDQPRVTIAGQSAPGDGIALKNHPLVVAADDVVVRYIRSRPDAERDAISVRNGRRIIFDHVSASGAVGVMPSASNVTVQWSILDASPMDAHGGSSISWAHNLSTHELHQASRDYERVLNSAGTSLARDAVDRSVVQSTRDRTGRSVDSQKQATGWPALISVPPLSDSDRDGMPDAWERANGFDPNAADDSADGDHDGYTNLEEYLHELTTTPAPRGEYSRPTYNGTAFPSLQAAIDALPATGGEILLSAGEYREKIVIDKPNVRLRGLGASPGDVVIVWSDAAVTAGGTFRSATMHSSGDNFRIENLTIQNDYHKRSDQRSQAVALSVTGDRVVIDHVRLLAAQDTLYAGTKKCTSDPCHTSRQYFSNCYIEGHVDFIFGDSKAFFERCRIHAISHPEILITAHARTSPDQDRAFVFNNCTITGEKGARIYFGRPWRDYAAVIFMNTNVEGELDPEGWREWTPGKTDRLKLAYYAEFNTQGRSSDMSKRQSYTRVLSAAEAQRWSLQAFFAGADEWNPALSGS
jgi:pectin methylesterase-like acyl-CoA thioesterase